MNYNPFFPGGAIAMARVIFDGLVEYDDSESPSKMLRSATDRFILRQIHPRRQVRWPKTS